MDGRKKVSEKPRGAGGAMRIVLIATKMLRIERKSLAWERKESNRCQGRGRLRNENASEAFD